MMEPKLCSKENAVNLYLSIENRERTEMQKSLILLCIWMKIEI